MIDQARSSADSPALKAQAPEYPERFNGRVPKRGRLLTTVKADLAFLAKPGTVAPEGDTFDAWTNSYGAASALLANGEALGLKPDEFEVVEWWQDKRRPRDVYVEKVTRWLMPDRDDPQLAAEARERGGLTGVYTGTSARIRRMVKLAYLRGVRKGASCAWEAAQPVVMRAAEEPE